MTDKTYVALWRRIFGSSLWLHITECRLFLFLVGKARRSEIPDDQFKPVIIKQGQYLRSYRKLAEDLRFIENHAVIHYSLSRIKVAVENLVKQNRITVEKTELGTLFTVVNYCKYQIKKKELANPERRRNAVGTPSERRLNNNKNVENVLNEDNKEKDSCENPQKDFSLIIWDYYKQVFKGVYRPRSLTKTRLSKIKARLKFYKPEEIQRALNNMRDDKYICGSNEVGKVYATPEYCFRSDEMIEKWLNKKEVKSGAKEDSRFILYI